MLRKDFFIQIERKKSSFDFRVNTGLDTFENNIQNNCQDKIILFKDGKELFSHEQIQTVANYPNCTVFDSIGEGDFNLVCFVWVGVTFADPNHPSRIKIHGIIDGKTIGGDIIESDSRIRYKDGSRSLGRVLMHTTYYPPKDKEIAYAYSEACLMHKYISQMDTLNQFLIENGVAPNDIIPCNLKEV